MFELKKLLFVALLSTLGRCASYGQKAYLDTEKYASCELFAQKSDYDWELRLRQMDSLESQEVTVFVVKGKDNVIQERYTGKVHPRRGKNDEAPSKGQATVLIVMVGQGVEKRAYFPLTNYKKFRIYLAGCLD